MAEDIVTCTALSIMQPWAWVIANRYKDLENRTWIPRFRGSLLIHAGKKFDDGSDDWIRGTFPHIRLPQRHEFEMGGIVGRARMTGYVTESESPWFFGPYGFVLKDQEPLPFHPMRGQLGFFRVEVPASLIGYVPAARDGAGEEG